MRRRLITGLGIAASISWHRVLAQATGSGTSPAAADAFNRLFQLLEANPELAESGRGIRYRLISLWPVYQRNAPATELERRALESFAKTPDRPFTGIVSSGRKQYFQAVYSDRAISDACIKCHNSHPLSPKRDFALNDVMGGMTITIPLD